MADVKPFKYNSTGRCFYLEMKKCIELCVLLFAVSNAVATDYYVSTNGNDSSNGLTLSTAFATGNKGASLASPGDTVFFADGTYTQNLYISRSGTSNAWITFKSINKWGARITVADWSAISIGGDSALDVGYIIIDGFEVSADHMYGCGVASVYGAHHVTVRNCWAHDCGQTGIQLNDGDYRVIENNVCNHNAYVTPPEGSGISLWGRKPFDTGPGWHNIIRGNVCYGNINDPSGPNSDGNGIIIDDLRTTQGGHTAGAKDIHYTDGETLIENNLCYNNGGAGIQMFLSNKITCRNNTCYMNQQRRTDDWWRGSLSASCCADIQVYNNISYASSSLRMDGGTTDCAGYAHNTAIGAYGLTSGDLYCTNYVYYNNITYDVNDPAANSIMMENISPIIAGAHGNLCPTNPLFVSDGTDFHFQPSSPAVNRGTSAFGVPSMDLEGASRPSGVAVDIGCYEYAVPPIAFVGISLSSSTNFVFESAGGAGPGVQVLQRCTNLLVMDSWTDVATNSLSYPFTNHWACPTSSVSQEFFRILQK